MVEYIKVLCAMICGILFHWAYVNRKYKNDWRIVWVGHAEMPFSAYNRLSGTPMGLGVDKLRYEIRFSQSRMKFKLDCYGSNAREHSKYKEAVEELNMREDSLQPKLSTKEKNNPEYKAQTIYRGGLPVNY